MADGTSICPHCDYIIDTTFLSGAGADEDEGTPTGAPQAAPSRPPARATGAKPAVRGTGARPASRPPSGSKPPVRGASAVRRPPRPEAPPSDDATNIAEALPESAFTRPSSAPARPVSKPRGSSVRPASSSGRAAAARAEPRPHSRPEPKPPPPKPVSTSPAVPRVTGSHRIISPEEMLLDLKHFVLELSNSDKLAFLGACVTVLLCFIPWKSTAAEGEILGLVSSGFIVLVAAVVCMSSVAVRVRKVMPQLNPIIPWLVQLGSGAFAILWCLVYIKISYNGQQVPADIGNEMVPLSSPSVGVFLALLSSMVSLAGTLMGLREKPT